MASVSAHKWAGVFRNLAGRFAQAWKNTDQAMSKNEIFEGFIVRHSKINNRVSTKVVDPEGFLLGFIDTRDGLAAPGITSTSEAMLWESFARDTFNPVVSVDENLTPKPADPLSVDIKRISRVYGEASFSTEELIAPTYYTITSASPTDGAGFGSSAIYSDTSSSGNEASDSYLPRMATIKNGHKTFTSMIFIEDHRDPSISTDGFSLNVVNLWVSDSYVSSIKNGYVLFARMYPASTLSGSDITDIYGKNIPIRMVRQVPSAQCVRLGKRSAAVIPVTTSPARNNFEFASGKTALMITLQANLIDGAVVESMILESDQILPDGVLVESWSSQVWSRSFTVAGQATYYMDENGDAQKHTTDLECVADCTVIAEYNRESISVSGHMPNSLGNPVLNIFDDRIEVFYDYRITRSCVDTRSTDIHELFKQATIQTQTGIVRLTIPYSISEDRKRIVTGPISKTSIRSDVSGSEGHSFYQLGGDRPDYHRLYRVLWAGVIGVKSVALVSIVKHKRWEYSAVKPYSGGDDFLWESFTASSGRKPMITAQSNISNGFWSPVVYCSYTDYEGSQRTDYLTRGTNLDGSDAVDRVHIAGDHGDGLTWDQAVGVGIIIDGVMTELDSSVLGWCMINFCNRDKVLNDDWLWEPYPIKWATVISDTEIAFCCFDIDLTHKTTASVTTRTARLMALNIETMQITQLRQDIIQGYKPRPAVYCYQRKVLDNDDKVIIEACLTYSVGRQDSDDDFIEVSKDSGVTWQRIWQGKGTPAFGATYAGSPLWSANNTRVFQ